MNYAEEYDKLRRIMEIELQKEFRIRCIIQIVCNYFNINKSQLKDNEEYGKLAIARQFVAYISHTIYGIHLSLIAEYLNYKNANSAFTANKALKEKLDGDKGLHRHLEAIRGQLSEVLNADYARKIS